MSLSDQMQSLEPIAGLIVAELSLIRSMRRDAERPEPEAEAATIAAGIAQLALALRPLQMQAIEMETAAAFAEA